MKTGDLVKMKHESWWNPDLRRKHYTDRCGIVYSTHAKGVKVLMPDGKIKVSLIDYWEVVSEAPTKV